MPPKPPKNPLKPLFDEITACEACPRLRKHCLKMAQLKRRAYASEEYWGKPITGFGDPAGRLVIVGLAPAAHGANRTGRIFTGDQSGFWLYRALHKHGFANLHGWERRDDGMVLRDAYVTCVVKCAPPDNKPSRTEVERCTRYLARELELLTARRRVYLALGQIALGGLWPLLEPERARPKFGHGAEVTLSNGDVLLMSYHPSQQNTFTKRLTEPMFDEVFVRAHQLLKSKPA